MIKNISEARKQRDGETTFLCCPCTEDGEPFMVVSYVSKDPFVASLVCPSCEQEVPVINGYLQK